MYHVNNEYFWRFFKYIFVFLYVFLQLNSYRSMSAFLKATFIIIEAFMPLIKTDNLPLDLYENKTGSERYVSVYD